MKLILYNNGADNRKMDKTKALIKLDEVEASIKRDTDIMNPTFVLTKNIQCNYIYAENLGRWYFVKNKRLMLGGFLEFDCHVDVLMTYRNVLRDKTMLIARNEFKRNTNLVDSKLITQANTNFFCKQVGNPVLNDYNIYLTTCGGVNGGNN